MSEKYLRKLSILKKDQFLTWTLKSRMTLISHRFICMSPSNVSLRAVYSALRRTYFKIETESTECTWNNNFYFSGSGSSNYSEEPMVELIFQTGIVEWNAGTVPKKGHLAGSLVRLSYTTAPEWSLKTVFGRRGVYRAGLLVDLSNRQESVCLLIMF